MYLVIARKTKCIKSNRRSDWSTGTKTDIYKEPTVWSAGAGHLAEYVSPDAYDEKFNQWRYEDLPIIPKRLESYSLRR